MIKNKGIKNNFKWLGILMIACIVLESIIYLYSCSVKKIYSKYHFIENETINLDFHDSSFVKENQDYSNLELNVPNNTKIYNVKLILKNPPESNLYVRLRTVYGDKLLPRSNYSGNEFKAYYKDGINSDKITIVFPNNNADIGKIDSIQINTDISYLNNYRFSFAKIIILYFVMVIIFFAIKYRNEIKTFINSLKLETFFLILIITFGVIYTFINVPLIRYDEHAHFWRAYEISLGKLKTDVNNEFPKSIVNLFMRENGTYPNREFNYENIKEELNTQLSPQNVMTFAVGASGGYSVVNYMATSLGTFLGRILECSPIIILYIGRIFNLTMYAILIYFSIRIVPSKKMKKIIGVISLFPMSLNLAASYSPDTVIIGFTMLSIAYALKLMFDDKIKFIKFKHIFLFFVLALVPTICKVVYVFLFVLLLFIPKEKFKTKYSKWGYLVIQMIVLFILYFILNVLLKGDSQITLEKNSIEQIIYCLSDPINCINILVRTISNNSVTYLTELSGGWNTPTILSIILNMILLLVTFEQSKEDKINLLNKKERGILLSISILESLAVFAALYIGWSFSCSPIVLGIQGRYFLPILPLFLLAISNSSFSINIKNKRFKYFIFVICTYIISIACSIFAFIN